MDGNNVYQRTADIVVKMIYEFIKFSSLDNFQKDVVEDSGYIIIKRVIIFLIIRLIACNYMYSSFPQIYQQTNFLNIIACCLFSISYYFYGYIIGLIVGFFITIFYPIPLIPIFIYLCIRAKKYIYN